jgi:hypothetical protein
VTPVIEAETLRYNQQPCRMFAATIGNESSQTSKIIGSKLLKHMCVVIHDTIVIITHRSRGVKNQSRVHLSELRQRVFTSRVVLSVQ